MIKRMINRVLSVLERRFGTQSICDQIQVENKQLSDLIAAGNKQLSELIVGGHSQINAQVKAGNDRLELIYDLMLHKQIAQRQETHPNPLNRSKFYGFAQSEEDGITLEILRRIGLEKGSFIEFGVGNGLENNTIVLLAAGWKGAWFGGEDLAFNVKGSEKLSFDKVWIEKDNIAELYKATSYDADVISLDLDGNDIYLIEELLENGAKPKLFIVEYNAKFPPPLEFQVAYDDEHEWLGDDYFGASLSSFCKLFEKNGYRLVCCNLSGANAFFVDEAYAKNFSDVPKDINQLYVEPFFFLRMRKMHPTSPRTLEKLVKSENV